MKVIKNLSNVKTLTDLMEIALRIDRENPLLVKWPFEETPKTISFMSFESKVGVYNSNNEILTFVLSDALFIIPCFENAWKAIYNSKLRLDSSLYCPLSYMGEYPIEYRDYWCLLKDAVAKQRLLDEYEYCQKISLSKNIPKLSNDILNLCTEIPEEGIYLKSSTYKVYPIITTKIIRDYLGHYNFNYFNDFSIFVHYDGRTFFSFKDKVIYSLQAAGYKKDETLIVPGVTFQKY